MKIRTTQCKTVSGDSPAQLDEAIKAARAEIVRQNEEAQLVDIRLAASQAKLFATIVWSG